MGEPSFFTCSWNWNVWMVGVSTQRFGDGRELNFTFGPLWLSFYLKGRTA